MDVGPEKAAHFALRPAVQVSDARNALELGTDIISPPGFEGFFEEVDMLARRGLPDMDQAVALAGKYGVEFLAPSPG
jgi:hypothetical protein